MSVSRCCITCYGHCVNVLKDYFSVWTSGVSLINPQRNANPGGQINKAIFPRLLPAAIPSSLIKLIIQQSVNFGKERLNTKINASPCLLLRCYLLFVLKMALIMFRYIVYILKWYYDENRILPIKAILKHKKVVCIGRKMLFTIFKYLFSFQRYLSFWNMQISQLMTSYTQPNFDQIWWRKISQTVCIRHNWFFAVRF